MSEELDNFFAKRKSKASKKKAIRLDEVAQTMEYSLKVGTGEVDPPPEVGARLKEPELPLKSEEDAEWIQFDSKPTLPLETVRSFNYTEQQEQEHRQNHQQQQQSVERAKIWKKPEATAEKESVAPAPNSTPVAEPPKPSAPAPYRPPNSRSGEPMRRGAAPKKVDLTSEELFPSLEKADQLAKEEKARIEAQKQASKEPHAPPASRPSPWQLPKEPQSQDARRTQPAQQNTQPEVPAEERHVEDPGRESSQPAPPTYIHESTPGVPNEPVNTPTEPVDAVPSEPLTSPPEEPIAPADDQQPAGNRPYVPRFMGGGGVTGGGYRDQNRDQNRDWPRQAPQQQHDNPTGPRGTGFYNARGEEIIQHNNPAPVVQGSWRQAAGQVIHETAAPPPARSPPADHQQQQSHGGYQQRDQRARPMPRSGGPPHPTDQSATNWRTVSSVTTVHHHSNQVPVADNWRPAPEHQHHQRTENRRPARTQEHHYQPNEPTGNWRSAPRTQQPQHPQHYQPAEPVARNRRPAPTQQQEHHEPQTAAQNWRETPTTEASDWRATGSDSGAEVAPADPNASDWQTVNKRAERRPARDHPSREGETPASGSGSRRGPGGGGQKYVPPQNRQ